LDAWKVDHWAVEKGVMWVVWLVAMMADEWAELMVGQWGRLDGLKGGREGKFKMIMKNITEKDINTRGNLIISDIS
jgi:hypothetical protein